MLDHHVVSGIKSFLPFGDEMERTSLSLCVFTPKMFLTVELMDCF